jgi:uncharacterized repeat protein (TIGR01451 family)
MGTTAGTLISNLAIVKYVKGASAPASTTSNTERFRVDEIIQPVLKWQDATPVAIKAPGSNAVLTFLLTNGGNGAEVFGLTRTNGPAPLPSDSEMPQNGKSGAIYLESGASAGFQASGPNADLLYVPGSNDPLLAPNASITIYVVRDTPDAVDKLHGEVVLRATALTVGAAGALPGTALAGLGQGGGFAVVGRSRAQSDATGGYSTGGLGLAMNKTVLKVLDPRGTHIVMPGAELTYRLVATLSGAGTASGLVITDPLPTATTYVPGSMLVDGLAQTDAPDADPAQFTAATQTVSVSLGNVAAPATVVIVFRATIN